MAERKHSRPITELAYETGKRLMVPPGSLHILGIYTLRLMFPPGSEVFGIETPIAIISSAQDNPNRWEVDFVKYALSDDGTIEDATSQFTADGNMYINNSGQNRIAGLGDTVNIGYILGDRNSGGPFLPDATVEVPDDLSGLEFEVGELLAAVPKK